MSNPILRYFTTDHLPTHLREVSDPFRALAVHVDGSLPLGPETSTALRKLLEAKDAAVRAALDLDHRSDLERVADDAATGNDRTAPPYTD